MADYKNDIEKYLKGELTPAQMHALEKKALDDPFLADALEGVQQLPHEAFLEDVQHLQNAINTRLQKKRTGSWAWTWRIAAGLLLLAASTYLIIFISSNGKPSENFALNEQKELAPAAPEQDDLSSSDSISESKRDDAVSLEAPAIEEQKKREEVPSAGPTESRSRADQSIAEIPSQKQEDLAESEADEELAISKEVEEIEESNEPAGKIAQVLPKDSPPPVVVLDAEEKKKRAFGAVKQEAPMADKAVGDAAKAPSSAYTSNRKLIRGKVTFSDDGTGLPGVNVIVKGSNEGTVTDASGNYEILVNEVQPVLSFSFIGFTNKEVEASSERLDVQLDADISELSEVVVVGYGQKSLGDVSTTPPVMELAAPAGGRKAFKQYLEKNLRYPEQALKNEVEGKVTIQFTIGMTGQLSDFSVIRGIGFGCEEEVIRLIKAGPKWSPTKKNDEPIRDRVRVRMRFSLPKK